MNALEVLVLIEQATRLITSVSQNVGTYTRIVQQARSEGRDELTDAEIAEVRAIALQSEERARAATS